MDKKSNANNQLTDWKKKFETETKISSAENFVISTDENINIKPLYIKDDMPFLSEEL